MSDAKRAFGSNSLPSVYIPRRTWRDALSEARTTAPLFVAELACVGTFLLAVLAWAAIGAGA